jgi:hypothetical protein|tara:strand:+ start:2080 stop:2388 length:309 start_codon:yes stop_codon:yes gene_type:complete
MPKPLDIRYRSLARNTQMDPNIYQPGAEPIEINEVVEVVPYEFFLHLTSRFGTTLVDRHAFDFAIDSVGQAAEFALAMSEQDFPFPRWRAVIVAVTRQGVLI